MTQDSAVLDLNSDLGEGLGIWTLGDDEAILGIVTSANIACGFHAGDPTIMRRVCTEAVRRGVTIFGSARTGPDGIPRLHLEFIDRQWPLEGID